MQSYHLPPRLAARMLSAAALAAVILAMLAAPTPAQIAQNVELLAHVDEDAGYNDVWGYSAPGGDEYAILGTTSGTAFYNVTVPTAPVRVGFIDGPNSTWRDMKTFGSTCYIVTEGSSPADQAGLQIVDLSNPEAPTLVNTVQGDFLTAHNIFIDTGAGHAWVVGTDAGTFIYDVGANATNPPVIGTYTTRYVHDVYVKNGMAYLAEIFDGRATILDASNPANLIELNSWSYPGASTHNTWTNDAQTLLVTTDETSGGNIKVWDITDPTQQIFLDEYTAAQTASAHNAFVRGDFIYASYYTEGLRVLSIQNPSAIEEVGYYDTFGGSGLYDGAWGCYPFAAEEGIAYISDITNGLFVLSFSANFGTLEGTVVDASTLQPIEDATVTIVEAALTRTTDASGHYSVALDPGSYTVDVSAFGYEPGTGFTTVTVGAVTTLDFALNPLPSGSLAGTVTDQTSAPIAGAQVTIDGTPLATDSGAAGGYDFPQVPTGPYEVRAQRFRYAPATEQATIVENQTTDLDFVLDDAFFWTEMETDPGWSVSGDASTGQWVRVDPNGTGGGAVQPEDDHTPAPGVTCWVTGQGTVGGPIGENDVDGGSTLLTTGTFDLGALTDPLLQYHRWYTNDAGSSPGSDTWLVEISADGGATWLILEQTQQSEAVWKLVEFRVRDLIPAPAPLSTVQVRFTASDLGSGSIVEAAVDDFQIVDSVGGSVSISGADPAPGRAFRVHGNAPNPFNPSTTIGFELPAADHVRLRIFDAGGRLVVNLVDRPLEAGSHAVTWDGRNTAGRPMASGVYFYRVDFGDASETRRMVLAK